MLYYAIVNYEVHIFFHYISHYFDIESPIKIPVFQTSSYIYIYQLIRVRICNVPGKFKSQKSQNNLPNSRELKVIMIHVSIKSNIITKSLEDYLFNKPSI